ASVTAGVAGSFTVTAKDSFGNTAIGYAGTVHFSSSDGQAVLPANTTLSGGTGSFSATLKTAGTQSITAKDTVTPSISGSQTGIIVSAAAATHFSVSAPASATAGVAFTILVTAQDAFNNTATSYGGTVHFTSTDGQATLPGNTTLSGGSGSFSATLRTAGSQTITATDTLTASITGTSNTVAVTAAAASSLIVSGFPSPTVSGTAGTFTVTAKDAFNNTATGYAGTVNFTSSDGAATLPGPYTFVGADNGMHVFGATLRTTGSQSLTATDSVTASITGSQSGIVVTASTTAVSFVVAGFPSPVTAGTAGTFTVTAKDASANTVTSYTGTVHFTSSDLQAVLPADYTFTNADHGVHTFTATLKTAGTRSLTATDTGSSSLTGSQTGITVNAAAASTLLVTGFPSPSTAGVAGSFTVTARDSFGNTASSYRGTVHFTSSDAYAVLPSNYRFTATDSGVHTFNGTLKTAGLQSITATDTVAAAINGSQTNITVVPAAASALTVSGFPSPIVAGTPGNFTVSAKDAFGNVATGYRGTVHFTSNDSKAVLPADYAFTVADNGIHSFTAILKTVGTRSITAK